MTKSNRATVLVVGGTGTVGSAAVRALVARGAKVRALVRSIKGASELLGAELVEGDLRDAAALPALLAGIHTAFYVSPHEPDEELLAETFIRGCELLSVRLVFVGVHADAKTRLGRALLRFVFGRHMPTYVPKLRISERARTSKTNCVVLMPTNFFDNDVIFRDSLLAGRFVQPFDRPFNRVAVEDIGAAAARVCMDPAFPSGAYPLVGPESLDGPACAAIWSKALGREVRYGFDDATFRAAVSQAARGKKVGDLIASYQAIRGMELRTSKKDLARTTALLGRPPTPYASYVRALCQAWAARSDHHAA